MATSESDKNEKASTDDKILMFQSDHSERLYDQIAAVVAHKTLFWTVKAACSPGVCWTMARRADTARADPDTEFKAECVTGLNPSKLGTVKILANDDDTNTCQVAAGAGHML